MHMIINVNPLLKCQLSCIKNKRGRSKVKLKIQFTLERPRASSGLFTSLQRLPSQENDLKETSRDKYQ